MQKAALAAAGLRGDYRALRCPAGSLARRLEDLANEGYRGLNLTSPLKEEGLAAAASRTVEAERIGAANVLRLREGAWQAHNTDAEGFRRALVEAGFSAVGRSVILLGAGGAARAAAYVLLEDGVAELRIWNRSPARAEVLLGELSYGTARLSLLSGDEEPAGADLIVQATSLGLAGDDLPPPLPAPGGRALALDMVTHETAWQRACQQRGCRVIDGCAMLVGQGESFEYWTGKAAPAGVMRGVLFPS